MEPEVPAPGVVKHSTRTLATLSDRNDNRMNEFRQLARSLVCINAL